MNHLNIIQILLVPLVILFNGCANEIDRYPYQPLVKPPKTVSGVLKQEPHTPETLASELVGKSSPPRHLWWKIDFLTSYKADKVVDTCLDYLTEIDASSQAVSIPIEQRPNDTRYPWLFFDHALYYIGYYDNSGNLKVNNREQTGFETIKTIVCLKPIVVVETKGLIIDRHNSGGISITRHSRQLKEILDRFGRTSNFYTLKHGYAYGTRIPYAENPRWFSPDMKIGPCPVEIDDNGIGHIPLSWGELVLKKQADEWIVAAKTRRTH